MIDSITHGAGSLVGPVNDANFFSSLAETSKRQLAALKNAVAPKSSTVETTTVPGMRSCVLTASEVEHDRQIRQQVATLATHADQIAERRAARTEAKRFFDEAAGREQQKQTDISYKRAVAAYEMAIEADAERKRIIRNNPRAFGLPWLRPNEARQNENLTSEIKGFEMAAEALKKKLYRPFAPVKPN
jgi:hypothetical protein